LPSKCGGQRWSWMLERDRALAHASWSMQKKKRKPFHPDLTHPLARTKPEIAAAEAHVRGILRFVGEDVKREGLLDTPARVVRALGEHFSGYEVDPGQYLAK